jgi:hypothetical protein
VPHLSVIKRKHALRKAERKELLMLLLHHPKQNGERCFLLEDKRRNKSRI